MFYFSGLNVTVSGRWSSVQCCFVFVHRSGDSHSVTLPPKNTQSFWRGWTWRESERQMGVGCDSYPFLVLLCGDVILTVQRNHLC